MQAAIKRTQENKKEIWEMTASVGVALEISLFSSSSSSNRTGQHFYIKRTKNSTEGFFALARIGLIFSTVKDLIY